MWEYLVKRIRTSRPDRESSDIHPLTEPHESSRTSPVRNDTERRERPRGRKGRASPHRRLLCPVCSVPMEIRMIGKVEVDQCPECQGIFLDRGELLALRGEEPSSYTHDKKGEEREFLLYTPHGLTEHLHPSEEEHHSPRRDSSSDSSSASNSK